MTPQFKQETEFQNTDKWVYTDNVVLIIFGAKPTLRQDILVLLIELINKCKLATVEGF